MSETHESGRSVVPKQVRIPCHRFELSALDYGLDSGGEPPSGARPSMLLVHGMRDLAWSMDSIAQAFAGSHRVVSLDLRGHGDSGQPGYYALPHFAGDLYTAIRHFELERPVLVGHSFGGEVASQLAGIFPELPSACVLIEGLGPPPWEGEVGGPSELVRRHMARTSIEDLHAIDLDGRRVRDLDAAVERLLEVHERLDPERARFLARRGTRPHPRGGLRWKWDPMLRTMWGSFSREVVEERWGWIECPVRVIVGSESGGWWSRDRGRRPGRPRERRSYLPAAELARRLALFHDATVTEIEEAGHMIHFDRPDALNHAIREFLEERGLPA